jgi:ABC-type multidrug transport system ATPase subunit
MSEDSEIVGDIKSEKRKSSSPKHKDKAADITSPEEVPNDVEHGYASKNDVLVSKASMLAASEDPFAHREGKTLVWRDINMTLAGKKESDPDVKLLDGVWGQVPDHKTTAIMGPSGAGKTSLLNILAGRAATRGRVTIDAEIRLNNYKVDPKKIEVRQHIAFVAQDDSLQTTATPREAIYFSAKLRLPRDTEEKTLVKLTNKMLKELGLESCADTYIGGALLKGISGGERKRTSIGVELVVKPAMVFLDEPTSGLDSYSAMQVCRVLQKVARAGSSVLFTIHQPASDIFNEFDQLILLNKGRVMYQGATDDISAYFAERGHPLPPKYNPADWIMNVAQANPIEELNRDGFFPEDDRDLPDADTEIFIDGKDEGGHKEGDELGDRNVETATLLTQINLLYGRELKNIARDKASIGARFGLTIFLSTLIGIIFLDVGSKDKSEPQVSYILFLVATKLQLIESAC